MATIYGNKLTHSSYAFNFFSYLTYSVATNDDTKYTLKLTGGLADNASGNVGWYFDTVQLVGTGQTTKTSSSFHYQDSGGNSNSSPGCCPAWSNVSWSWTKTHATQSVTVKVQSRDSSWSSNGWSTASYTVSIPAKTSYKITYNGNGGTVTTASSTKWYDESLTLVTSGVTRTGYRFLGWGTSTTATTTISNTYITNAAKTLYAVWEPLNYSIVYNRNSGNLNGRAANITVSDISYTGTYYIGREDNSSSTSYIIPTRTGYNFIGWGTSTSGVTYTQKKTVSGLSAGGTVTLYAIWESQYTAPSNININNSRCTSNGTEDDEGTYGLLSYKLYRAKRKITTWTNSGSSTDQYSCPSMKGRVHWTDGTNSSYSYFSISEDSSNISTNVLYPSSGLNTVIYGGGNLDKQKSYTITVTFYYFENYGADTSTITTSKGNVSATDFISQAYFIMDINATGQAIGFGGAVADNAKGVFINLPISMRNQNDNGSFLRTREQAALRFTTPPDTSGHYAPCISIKSYNGSWAIGPYGTALYFAYVSDSDYENGINVSKKFLFNENGNLQLAGGNTLAIGTAGTTENPGPTEIHIKSITANDNVQCISIYDEGNSNGQTMRIGAEATTIIGGGESSNSILNNAIDSAGGTTENLYLGSDGDLYLYTNCNTIANRKRSYFTAAGNFVIPGAIYCANDSTTAKGTVTTHKLFKVASKTISIGSMAASTTIDATVSLSEDGYVPVGVVGYDLNGSGCAYITVIAIRTTSSGCYYQLSTAPSAHAASGDPTAVSLIVYILYIASKQGI